MNKFYFILFFFFLTGCTNKTLLKEKEIPIPQWFTEKETNTKNEYFNITSSITKSLSIKKSLSNIEVDIVNDIYNIYNENKHLNDKFDFYKEKLNKNDIDNVLSKINIKYKILNEIKINDEKYLIKLKVLKEDVFIAIKNKLDNKIIKFNKIKNDYNNENIFNQIDFLKRSHNDFHEIKLKTLILKILNKNLNENIYLDFFKKLKFSYKKLIESINLKFRYTTNNTLIIDIIKEELSNNKYSFINNNKYKKNLLFVLNSRDKRKFENGKYFVIKDISYLIKDKNKKVTENNFLVKGVSKKSYIYAEKELYENFIKEIKNKLFKIKYIN